jgi:pilus assembly protein FimV
LVACSATFSLPAFSLGLGEIEMQSFLNEPLRAEVELLDTRALTVDDIRIRLGGNDDFERLGIDRSFFLTGIKFDIEVDEANGRGVIRLRTEDAVLEPYLDLIIEARWPSGRLLREYTVLVDPPAFRQELITVSASERVDDENPDKPARAPEPAREPAPPVAQDGVALRESSLPPGEMPARAFSAETVDTPRAGNRYMVRRDETLWQIAAQGKPQGISVQQAMLDIQRLNPEAFINGNINQVKAGYIIYLPAAGEVEFR